MDSSQFYIHDYESDAETRMRLTRTFMQEMTMFKRLYGEYPPIIIFKGKLGRIVYDIVVKNNLNFGATIDFVDYYDNEIIMKSDKEITMQEDKAHEFGMIYTKETKVKPEYSIKIVKL